MSKAYWRMREALWSFDETLYRLGAACFALWLCSIAIFFGTAVGLPRFRGGANPPGCYLSDALLIYVECRPEVWGGGVIEVTANFSWWLVLYSWIFAAPTLSAVASGQMTPSAAPFAAGVVAFASITLFGALAFIVAALFRRSDARAPPLNRPRACPGPRRRRSSCRAPARP